MAEPLAQEKAVPLHQLRIFKAVADHLTVERGPAPAVLSTCAIWLEKSNGGHVVLDQAGFPIRRQRRIVHLRRRRLPGAVSGFVEFLGTGKWKPASSGD